MSEYAGAANRPQLLSLLLPVQRAAAECPWLKTMVEEGEIYHPLRWTPVEAFQLLTDTPRLEAAGIIVRVPAAWRANRPPRPQVTATVGGKPPSGLGTEALLDFKMGVSLDGEPLTKAEIEQLLAGSNGLHLVRGRWVEVDRERLNRMLDEFRAVETAAAQEGLSFGEAMRLLAGAHVPGDIVAATAPDWASVVAGPWLAKTLAGLRDPAQLAQLDPGAALKATLRPYQQAGVRWLHLLSSLGLGACLADDMGLGKTMQVLALLLVMRARKTPEDTRRTSLLVAPASLLANWTAEIERFAPTLTAIIAHPSAMTREELTALIATGLPASSSPATDRCCACPPARHAVAPRHPGRSASDQDTRRQTDTSRQADRCAGTHRAQSAEHRWKTCWRSLVHLRLSQPRPAGFGEGVRDVHQTPLVTTPQPVRTAAHARASGNILRRLKTDKSVIADLPDKTEVRAFCHLTRKQAALYQQSVAELATDGSSEPRG